MKLLLDTHAFLWFITDDPKLSATGRSLIADAANDILVSPASYWEIAIKVSIGKYPLSAPFETFITQAIADNEFAILPIEPKHAAVLTQLPFHHRDPFDRLIIAQATAEQMPVVFIGIGLQQSINVARRIGYADASVSVEPNLRKLSLGGLRPNDGEGRRRGCHIAVWPWHSGSWQRLKHFHEEAGRSRAGSRADAQRDADA